MSIALTATRDSKLKWLMKPFDWAMNVAILGALWGIGGLIDDSIGSTVSRYLAIACSFVVFGLLLWGVARISNVARSL